MNDHVYDLLKWSVLSGGNGGNSGGGGGGESGGTATLASLIDGSITEVSDSTVTTVKAYTFYYCGKLASVNLPNLTTIGQYAFAYCDSLPSLSLLRATRIDGNAFQRCSKLTLILLPATPPTLSSTTAFNYASSALVLSVPKGALAAYQEATNWSDLTTRLTFVERDS